VPEDYNNCMRRLLSIAVIAAVGLIPAIMQSQMRGMGGGGAHASAPARGGVAVRSGPVVTRGGPVVAPHFATGGVRVVSPGVRVVSPGVRVVSPGVRVVSPSGVVVTRSGVVVARAPFVHFHNRFRNPFFFNGCFNGFNCGFFPGFGFGFGFGSGFGFGAAYPYYGAPYPYDYNPPPPPAYYPSDYYGMAAPQTSTQENANDIYLAQQLQKLSDEVEAMKNDQKGHTGSAVVLGPKADAQGPAVTFIFHDGTRISTHNYAVAGQTLWIFGENQARKFRLGDLDRAATEQANAANGVELRLPEPAPEH